MEKILTIIIPSYNMEAYLERCLSSLLVDEDLMDRFEALVINDGSKDGTSEIGRRYEGAYPDTFRVIDKENGHYGSCVNRGLAEAKGTFVKILDADDAFETDTFKHYLAFISQDEIKEKADLIISGYRCVFDDGAATSECRLPIQKDSFSLNELSTVSSNQWFIHLLCYRKSLFNRIHYSQTEGIAYTDHEWSFYPLSVVTCCYKFDGTLYLYTMGREGQSIDARVQSRNLWMEASVLEKLVHFYQEKKEAIIARGESHLFMEKVLRKDLTHIYELFLVVYQRMKPDYRSLHHLDDVLHNCLPSFYTDLENHQVSIGGIHFRPIRAWRKRHLFALDLSGIFYSLVNSINKYFNWKRRHIPKETMK